MTKPLFPRWADTVEGDPTKVISPSSGKQDIGWIEEEPPFQIENWLRVKAYRTLKFLEAFLEAQEHMVIRSASNVAWSGTAITFSSAIQVHFRNNSAGALYINQIAAGGSPIALADGDVVVLRKDRTNASPITLALQNTYGSLAKGEYAIVAQASLALTNYEDELILFRRNGTDLEIPALGQIYATGSSFKLGKAGVPNTYKHTEAVASTSWTVNHNLGTIDHIVQVFDAVGNGHPVSPDDVTRGTATDTITFAVAQAGTALLIPVL